MTMFKSCPSLCWECTPMLAPSPARPGPVHVCEGSVNSQFANPAQPCSAAQHCTESDTSSQWGASIQVTWSPAANEEPGGQLWTNERPWNYHLSSSSHRLSRLGAGSLDLGEANKRGRWPRHSLAQPWHPRHRQQDQATGLWGLSCFWMLPILRNSYG